MLLRVDAATTDQRVQQQPVLGVDHPRPTRPAANRFYVHASVEAESGDQLEHALAAVRVGAGADRTNGLGAMVSVKEPDEVQALLQAGEAAGEIFGPVAPVVVVEDQDQDEGVRVARQMTSGMVPVNRGVASDPAAPFGGTNESGLGREGGSAGASDRRLGDTST